MVREIKKPLALVLSERFFVLDKLCLFEGGVCAVLVDGLNRAGREGEAYRFFELRDIDLLGLKVEISASLAGRVVLRRTGSVRIATAND